MNSMAVANIHSPRELPDVGRLIPSSLEALFSWDWAFITISSLMEHVNTCTLCHPDNYRARVEQDGTGGANSRPNAIHSENYE